MIVEKQLHTRQLRARAAVRVRTGVEQMRIVAWFQGAQSSRDASCIQVRRRSRSFHGDVSKIVKFFRAWSTRSLQWPSHASMTHYQACCLLSATPLSTWIAEGSRGTHWLDAFVLVDARHFPRRRKESSAELFENATVGLACR